MEKKCDEENILDNYSFLSIYLDKVIESINKNIIDYQSNNKTI